MKTQHTPTPWTSESLLELFEGSDSDAIDSFVRSINKLKRDNEALLKALKLSSWIIEQFKNSKNFADVSKEEILESMELNVSAIAQAEGDK